MQTLFDTFTHSCCLISLSISSRLTLRDYIYSPDCPFCLHNTASLEILQAFFSKDGMQSPVCGLWRTADKSSCSLGELPSSGALWVPLVIAGGCFAKLMIVLLLPIAGDNEFTVCPAQQKIRCHVFVAARLPIS